MLECPKCGGRMASITVIENAYVIMRILDNFRLPGNRPGLDFFIVAGYSLFERAEEG